MKSRIERRRRSSKKERLSVLLYKRFLLIVVPSTLALMMAVLIATSIILHNVERSVDTNTMALVNRIFDSFFQTTLEEGERFTKSVERLALEAKYIEYSEKLGMSVGERNQVIIGELSLPSSASVTGVERITVDSLKKGLRKELENLKPGDYYISYSMGVKGNAYLMADVYVRLPERFLVIHLVKTVKGVEGVLREVARMSSVSSLINALGLYTSDFQPLVPGCPSLTPEDREHLREAIEHRETVHERRGAFYTVYSAWAYEGKRYGFEPVGILLRFDLTSFRLLSTFLIFFFVATIVIVALLVVLRSKRFASRIARPFERLVKSIERFRENRFLEFDDDLEDCSILEVDELTQSYRELAEEVLASFQELRAMNEELQESYQRLRELNERLENVYLEFARSLAIIAEGFDEVTGNHVKRVGMLSRFIADKMGMDEEFLEKIERFAPLHDIGKIMVDKAILNKPGKLTEEEFGDMKKHTIYGAALLGGDEHFDMARKIALYHHEKWNGRGYPFGLKGNEIPIEAAIVALVDVYDALRSDRPYKKAFTHERTIEILRNGDERTNPDDFNPDVLKVFMEYESEIRQLWDEIERESEFSLLRRRIDEIMASGGVG